MLERLSERFQKFLKTVKGEGTLNSSNIDKALREVRLALLEADVNYKTVKEFVENLRERLQGKKVSSSFTPYQVVVKIVKDELTLLLGGQAEGILKNPRGTSVYMLEGLQGAGKTTTAGKLAAKLKKEGKVLLLSLDLKRAAAQEQLETIAKWSGVDFLPVEPPLEQAVEKARIFWTEGGYKFVIIDTAGRLHIDESLMSELARVKEILKPTETFFVADAMTGQDAVRSASKFLQDVGFDSVILTKLDGDARGGAALSIRHATGKPIKFIGVGEKLEDLEPFVPERIASRILGMGDILTLIEKTEEKIKEDEARRLAEKLKKQEFTLEDLRDQIRLLKKMGGLSKLISFLPNLGPVGKIDDKQLIHMEAIINSMTPKERRRPEILNGSRKRRIAKGSGRPVSEVNRLLKGFFEMRRMMKSKQFKKFAKGIDISKFMS